MQQPKLTEKNRVIIRVWKPIGREDAKKLAREKALQTVKPEKVDEFVTNNFKNYKSCGHVSIETRRPNDTYYSLWPVNAYDKSEAYWFVQSIDHTFKTYDEDLEDEGRDPDIVICLYSLKGFAINSKFDQIAKNLEGWRMIGSNCLARISNSKSGESCASLAYRLLVGGGLKNLVNSSVSTKESCVVTPTDLEKIAIKAKKAELKDHPETAAFQYDDETPSKPEQEKDGQCLVM